MRPWQVTSATPTEDSLARPVDHASVAEMERELAQSWLETRLSSELTSYMDTRALVDTHRPYRGVDIMWRDGSGSDSLMVIFESKRLRRGYREALEREAFNEQVQAYRTVAARKLARDPHFYDLAQVEKSLNRRPDKPTRGGSVPNFAAALMPITELATFERGVTWLANRVVVLIDGLDESPDRGIDTLPVRQGRPAPPGRLRVQVVSAVEAFLTRVDQAAARKRLGTVLRTRLGSLSALVHAAGRHLSPPGRLVAASPRPTRGPNSTPLKTMTSFLSGMSLTYA